MKKTTIVVMIVTIVAKIFGFLRDLVITNVFSVGSVSDAFTFAYSLPSMVFTVITATLVTGFVPMYSRVLKEGKERANSFANNVFNIINILALVVGLLFMLVPEFLVGIAATGFTDDPVTFGYAVTFVRLISLSTVGMAIAQLGTGYLNVHQSFIIPNLISIPGNLIIIVCAILGHSTNQIWLLGLGALFSYLFQGFIIFMQMRKVGFKFKLSIDLKDQNLRTMVMLSIPLLLSALITTGNDMFTRSYATDIFDTGAYTYITYAARLQGFATGLFVTGILSVAYPTITRAVVDQNKRAVIHSVNDAILMIALFILPAMVGMFLLSDDIVSFVYANSDKFNEQNVAILSSILKGYVVGIFFFGLRDLFTRVHYAFQDMKRPLYSSVIYIIVNIVGCLILGPIFGLPGLSIANTLAIFVSTIYLLWSAAINLEILRLAEIGSDFLKILISSILMGAVVYFTNGFFLSMMSSKLALIATIVCAVIVYLVAILALRVNIVTSMLKRKEA